MDKLRDLALPERADHPLQRKCTSSWTEYPPNLHYLREQITHCNTSGKILPEVESGLALPERADHPLQHGKLLTVSNLPSNLHYLREQITHCNGTPARKACSVPPESHSRAAHLSCVTMAETHPLLCCTKGIQAPASNNVVNANHLSSSWV